MGDNHKLMTNASSDNNPKKSLEICDALPLPSPPPPIVASKEIEPDRTKTAPRKDHKIVKPGMLIQDKWVVVNKIGEGACGSVFEVRPTSSNERVAAMKVEPIGLGPKAMLKMEVFVLRQLETLAPNAHVPKIYAVGKNNNYSYMVMTLLGPTLQQLRQEMPKRHFTCATTTRVAQQALNAIEAVHLCHFIHRDIKPCNFSIGPRTDPRQVRIVFLIDFGMARKFTDDKGRIKGARKNPGFRGTYRYCSPHVHRHIEQGRNDDLYSFMYTIIELLHGLPWGKCVDKEQIAMYKETISDDQLFGGDKCPHEYRRMLLHIKMLDNNATPDYAYLQDQLAQIVKRKGYKANDPYDWEQSGGKDFQYTRRDDDERACVSDRDISVDEHLHTELTKYEGKVPPCIDAKTEAKGLVDAPKVDKDHAPATKN